MEDNAFIVGGQALNIWAERYYAAPELSQYGPYTSKDIDYFGHREAAEKLAQQLGGQLRIPEMDNVTPQSAIVCATVDGVDIEIDFLTHVLGVKPNALERSAAEIIAPLRVGDEVTTIEIPIMHPLHCLQSRLANVVKLGRKDDVARRQLAAAPYVVREYVSEVLDAGDNDEASQTLQRLFEYLRSDIHGRVAHEYCENDPAAVIDHFADDARFDPRYRENNIATMQKVLKGRRESRGLLLQNIAAMRARGSGR